MRQGMESTSSFPEGDITESIDHSVTESMSIVDSVTKSIEPMFDAVPPLSSDYCMYRVPERLRSVKPEAYTPIVVSIGPFHHGKSRLQTMEHHKTLYLYFLLHRRPEIGLSRYVKVLSQLESRARNCYAETISYTKEEFIKILLLDGCFLVELFRQYQNPMLRQNNDQLFKNHWIFNAVHRDVLLLENQIPFFVLQALFGIVHDPTSQYGDMDISGLARIFLGRYKTIPSYDPCLGSCREEHLLLSVLKNITIQDRPINSLRRPYNTSLTFIPSATELSKVGVRFASLKSSNLFDVTFRDNGVLYASSLIVDDRTESSFRNLVALEQTHSKTTITENQSQSPRDITPKITCYVLLMDCLINTSADVALLRDHGIIYNQLGDDEEVAQLFNKLRTGIIMNPDEFFFTEIFTCVNIYYHTKWNQWKAMFFREFWSTPWAKTSVVAATILLMCTMVQTICSILQVLPHCSK